MLYKEASRILQCIQDKRGAMKNLVLSSNYQNKKQLFALVAETLKYKKVLKSIIETTKIQKYEKILKQDNLALVMVYDFLLGKGFGSSTNSFKEAIMKHQGALKAELARQKVKARAETNEDLLPNSVKEEVKLPRYVRVNSLKTTMDEVISHFRKEDYTKVSIMLGLGYDSYLTIIRGLKKKQFAVDPYITDLLVFSGGTDLHDHTLYTRGDIILQDRASCIPAHVLAPTPGSHVIDCCAAPGNKTSHLAAIMQNKGKLYAFDKDMKRAATLSTQVLKAGVLCASCRHADFLQCDPDDPEYRRVEYVLVDPSCSGSGIVTRQNHLTDDEDTTTPERLASLSRFQMMILSHALSFPAVKRVAYSTCSTHQQENETVVNEVLKRTKGHFVLEKVLKDYPNRGEKLTDPCDSFQPKKCLRLDPKKDLTNGFFVSVFVRVEGKEGSVRELVKVSKPVKSGKSNGVRASSGGDVKKNQNLKRTMESTKKPAPMPQKKQRKEKPKKQKPEKMDTTESRPMRPVVGTTSSNAAAKSKKKKRTNRHKRPVTA